MMDKVIASEYFHKEPPSRGHLIDALRAALNAAEQGEDVVSIIHGALEVSWDFDDGVFVVLGDR